jgi:hypothetical protein
MPKEQHPKLEDEPGAEERFRRGIETALRTPPKPKEASKPPLKSKA